MADQVIERARFVVVRQPRLLDVALDQATTCQQLTHLCGDLPNQPLQFGLAVKWFS